MVWLYGERRNVENIEQQAYKDPPDIEHLRDIAIFLEGVKQGKGNITPLGFIHLNSLWDIYKDLRDKKRKAV